MLERARKAAAFWPIDVQSLTLAAHRENAVFRIDGADGTFALRLHRTGYRTDAELQAEMQVMHALAAAGCAVPKPVLSKSGHALQLWDGVQVTVLTWLRGEPFGETGKLFTHANREHIFSALGVAIAKMHNALDEWTPPQQFQRQHWNAAGLLGDHPHWGRFWENPELTDADKALLLKVRQDLKRRLHSQNWDYGYIHADLVSENLLVDEGKIHIIDFDDSGFGFRLQDIATALVKHHAEPDYVNLKHALVSGYQQHRPLDVGHIDMFLLIRRLSYLGWILPRMQDEGAPARAARFHREALAAAHAYVVAAP